MPRQLQSINPKNLSRVRLFLLRCFPGTLGGCCSRAIRHTTTCAAAVPVDTMTMRVASMRAASLLSRRLGKISVPAMSRLSEVSRPMASMAAGNALNGLAQEHPTMDAIRYGTYCRFN